MAKLFYANQLPSAPKPEPPPAPEVPKPVLTEAQIMANELQDSFKDKKFSDLTAQEKDDLLKLIAIRLNIIAS